MDIHVQLSFHEIIAEFVTFLLILVHFTSPDNAGDL